MKPEITEIHYRIQGGVSGLLPGAHRSSEAGAGTLFHGVTDFLHHADLRRLEPRRSYLDPFQRLYVRVFEQRSVATVIMAFDLSASMGAAGSKPEEISSLMRGLSAGARRLGDRFGAIGFDTRVRRDWIMPPLTATGWVEGWCQRLQSTSWKGTGAAGALELADWLPAQRCLVILISDFHWPDALIRRAVSRLGRHQVVPAVLWHRGETEAWPRWGLRRVCDAETGRESLIWLRPGWRRALEARYRQRRRHLARLFLALGQVPLWLEDGVDPVTVERYFQGVVPC